MQVRILNNLDRNKSKNGFIFKKICDSSSNDWVLSIMCGRVWVSAINLGQSGLRKEIESFNKSLALRCPFCSRTRAEPFCDHQTGLELEEEQQDIAGGRELEHLMDFIGLNGLLFDQDSLRAYMNRCKELLCGLSRGYY